MGSVISKWILPGILTVVIGTIGTLFFTQTTIETDLAEKSLSAISVTGDHSAGEWAKVTFSGRDGTISGITTDANAADALIAEISALHGVRSIVSDITQAPTASPYPFKAILSEDGALALSGGVPSFAMRDALLEQTGGTDAGLELMSGAPEGDWLAATGFAVSQLDGLSNGQASLSDLSLSVSGLAKTADSHMSATTGLVGTLPNGIELANVSIEPAFVENYVFKASRVDGQIVLSGFVPDEATRTKVGDLTGASTSALVLASGAPATFGSSLDVGLGALGHMSNGELDIANADVSVSGQAASFEDFDMISQILASSPDEANITMASIEQAMVPSMPAYRWSAEKFTNGTIVVSGSVADEASRAAIMARAGTGAVDNMTIAKGAPDNFYEDALVGISAIMELNSGRTGYSTDGWFLNGQPETVAAKTAAADSLITARTLADNWNVNLSEAYDVVPYQWAADKSADGTLTISGNVPDEATRAAIMARAGANASDKMTTANGAPATFYEDALVAISSVKELETGRAGHSSSGWFLFGDPATKAASDAAINGLNTARTNSDLWYIAVSDAPPVPVVPYTWTAVKSADGTLTVAGNVPDEATRAAIMARAGEGSIDNMQIGFGAPAHFYEDSLVAVSAVKELSSGRTGNGGGGWYLAGQTETNEARDLAIGSLIAARTQKDMWSVSIPEHEVMVQEEMAEEAVEETAFVEQPEINISNNFEAVLSPDSGIALSGMVPSNQSRIYLGQISGGVLTSNLVVAPRGAPADFAQNSTAGIRGLHRLIEGRMAYEDGVWSLIGRAANTTARTSALTQIAGLDNSSDWQVEIATPTLAEICQVQIENFEAENTIEFATGSALITRGSMSTLQELVTILLQCPNAAVHVEGHTDNQGDFVANLKLSSDRADSVVTALTKFGIADTRLFAIGFGEDQPIASNDTAEGRQLNRRIIFKVVE